MEERSTRVYRQKQMFSKAELAQRERLCIHDEPAYCVAACPVKVDAKAMQAAVAAGDFVKALTLYEKATPFVHLLSSGCEAPCEQYCKLCQLGDGISIRAIEAAAVTYGAKPQCKGLLRFKKKTSVAIFGTSLFSIFLAGELARKAYPLAVYCQEADAAAILLKVADFLESEQLEAETAVLMAMDIDFRFNSDITSDFFKDARSLYDVCCLSPSLMEGMFPCSAVDPETMMCGEINVISMPADQKGVISSAFAAKKAALTVDRLAQGLAPDCNRGEEGPVETALITTVNDVVSAWRVCAASGHYTRAEAVAEASRCIQCGCEECIKGCAFLQHYKKYPRLLTREIYNNVSIIMGDHIMNKPINSCALCGQCTVLCPNSYDMAEICLMARRNMVATEKMPLAPHEFALLDQSFSNSEAFLCRPQPGYARCDYVFFPGCQASAIAPDTVRAAWQDLASRLPGGVALMLGCCGAIAEWAGRDAMAEETMAFIDEKLSELGHPIVITACPTCQKMLARQDSIKLIGIWDVLENIGLPTGLGPQTGVVAIHDACGARGDRETQRKVRTLVKKLGCKIVEPEFTGEAAGCCGYGGLVMYANRDVAQEMASLNLKSVPNDATQLSYCMACRDRYARAGSPSRHLLELVYGTDAGAPPDISQKRYNRLRLKDSLLQEVWGGKSAEMSCRFPIEYSEQAQVMMDERMILESDIVDVLDNMRATGDVIADTDSGLLITRKRIGNITCWVKFQEKNNGYLIHSAYSHRMKIELRQGMEAAHGG